MQHARHLNKGNARGNPRASRQDHGTHTLGIRLIHVELGDVGGVQVHRQRSSSRNLLLSPGTCGMLAQNSFMSGGSTFFFLVVNGRSSATGSPRRSIVITSPSAASRTSSE